MKPRPLWFTFCNHMHWVDMTWLWGEGVLPGSLADQLRLQERLGLKGCLDFDGPGYENLAARHPEAFESLRKAVREGRIEITSGTWGQPYGVFQGEESNLRQCVEGVRCVLRLFGVRPRSFWEEEFDAFPQLPQILAACGFERASLFFQWTWHTPEVPEEEAPVVLWEAPDGTRLPCATRNALCLHQWPEDFDGRLDTLGEGEEPAGIQQWVELLPSPDWMCRSEILEPRLRELQEDPRFSFRSATLAGWVEALRGADPPVRRYRADDFWHGMTAGKNGDRVPRLSARAEAALLRAETLHAACGHLGRPYPSWDVWPSWEFEQSWRDLLTGQHHDNHECEGLCGEHGRDLLEASCRRARRLEHRARALLESRVPAAPGARLVVNRLGRARPVLLRDGRRTPPVPAAGWAVVPEEDLLPAVAAEARRLAPEGGGAALEAGGLVVETAGDDLAVAGEAGPRLRLGRLRFERGGETLPLPWKARIEEGPPGPRLAGALEEAGLTLDWSLLPGPLPGAAELHLRAAFLEPPDGGLVPALRLPLRAGFEIHALRADQPFSVEAVEARRDRPRKYPSGPWMTSEQWFETVPRPFHASTFADLRTADGSGVLIVHDGSMLGLRVEAGFDLVLCARDPWDEQNTHLEVEARIWLVPHGRGWTDARCLHCARELRETVLDRAEERPPLPGRSASEATAPPVLGLLSVEPESVVLSALYREPGLLQQGLPGHFAGLAANHNAAEGIAGDIHGPGIRDPHVLRIWNAGSEPVAAVLSLAGTAARAARTTPLGEVLEPLEGVVEDGAAGPVTRFHLALRPWEIATLMADLVEARQIPRRLDAWRKVWAQVHRQGEAGRD